MKRKRAGLAITGLLVVAIIAVGATLALLSTTTGTKTNAFSSNRNISIQLRENEWDGYTFDNKEGDSTTGLEAIKGRENDMTLGVNQAKAYLPGQNIPKNPTVKNNNTSDNGVETRVALKVTYFIEEQQVNYETFKNKLLATDGIKFNDQWKQINGNENDNMADIYLYQDVLGLEDINNTTTPLFSTVPINKNLQPNGEGKLPKFNIKVQAYAIQAGIDGMNIKEEMVKFINANNAN
ncbi:hypothetical protein SAMN04515624_10898 [Eubacterium maltosivorans]|uniref:hypothetical protein n=1 Tax=Eubacterium maltosivorans TaxID=2041044 RepID=UPI0008914F91|nr:hypothetical protein [Eubacterium maltosivorans]WPK81715.1 hypothetical protein EUMA32_31720 [Eubacterium maltosivorans]SDP28973.1 hypothetical protein SAMN04515624_10898 [Eubacterium maltosivorans]